jgi:hypothetical protein
MEIQEPLRHLDHVSVDDFFDGLDKLIGQDRPCPICGATEWATWSNCMAGHFTMARPDGTGQPGSLHLAIRICRRCRFVRTHLLAPEDV